MPFGDALANLGAQHQPVRARHAGHGWRSAALSASRSCGVVADSPGAAGANQIDGAVHGNPVEPGPEIGPGLETAQLLIRLEERVLDDVLGVRRAAGEPIRHVEDVARVTLDERTERLAVTVAGLGDGRPVAFVHPNSLTRVRRRVVRRPRVGRQFPTSASESDP